VPPRRGDIAALPPHASWRSQVCCPSTPAAQNADDSRGPFQMSEGLKFVASAGAVFTALAGFLWAIATKTEELMRDEVKEGFAAWLKSTQLDRQFRDWCYSFTSAYDVIFGIRVGIGQFSFPNLSRTAIFAVACVIIVFVAFGQLHPALIAIDRAMHYNDLYKQFPEFARSIVADLTLMLFLVLLLSIAGIYVSVLKTRVVLAKFVSGTAGFKRVTYIVIDVFVSLLIFFIIFQVSHTLQEESNLFVIRNIFTKFKYLPYDPPRDLHIASLVSEVNFRFLLPTSMSVLVPIVWTVMFAVGGFAAKGLMYVETLRRFAVANFELEKHPLLVTSWCIIAMWCFLFWIPVGIYYALFYLFKA
jgi:hypothetical protein